MHQIVHLDQLKFSIGCTRNLIPLRKLGHEGLKFVHAAHYDTPRTDFRKRKYVIVLICLRSDTVYVQVRRPERCRARRKPRLTL